MGRIFQPEITEIFSARPEPGPARKMLRSSWLSALVLNFLSLTCCCKHRNFFLTFFPLNFAKIYGPKKLQNYTSSAVGDGGRDLPPCPTG
jgi:hypothetical protein